MKEFCIGDEVYCKPTDLTAWIIQRQSGLLDLGKPYFRGMGKVDKTKKGIIRGFQSPEFDGRDVIVRWKSFYWDTTVPKHVLVKAER